MRLGLWLAEKGFIPDFLLRIAIRKLNSLGGSICLDLLSEEQLQQLIDTQSEEVA